jgi:hypothetical protein
MPEMSDAVLSDLPTLHCPFIRRTFPVDREQWRKHGGRLGLREPEAYLEVDRVNPGYEWVFEHPDTFAVEKLDVHLWYPFGEAVTALRYRSFHEHERTFGNWSSWLKDYLFSRFYTTRASRLGLDGQVFAEGVVLTNLTLEEQGKIWMAKPRRDRFDRFHAPDLRILGFDPGGRDVQEDQEKLD